MKASGIQPTTLQYPASTSKAGYRQLEQAMLQMGHLRNALIRHRDSARGSHRHAFNLSLQNTHLTDLHRHDPDIQEVRPPTAGVGRPRSKQIVPHLLQTSRRRPAQLLQVPTRTAPSRYPSRPTCSTSKCRTERLGYHPDQGTPHHQAPRPTSGCPQTCNQRAIRITLKPRRLAVSLVYQQEPRGPR